MKITYMRYRGCCTFSNRGLDVPPYLEMLKNYSDMSSFGFDCSGAITRVKLHRATSLRRQISTIKHEELHGTYTIKRIWNFTWGR
jgi:hypothetical protein